MNPMESLLDMYGDVSQEIKRILDRITGVERQIQKLKQQRMNGYIDRITHLRSQLIKIDEYLVIIHGYIQMAEAGLSSKNVLTIEAPPGYKVNLNRLRQWALKIDPLALEDPEMPDDPYAQKLLAVALCDLRFLEQKKVEFKCRIVELEEEMANETTDEIKALEEKHRKLEKELQDYGCSEEVFRLVKEMSLKNVTE